jgi:phospholipid/cholesterol/gamma-HCH transport system ATP-binding protein
VNSESSNLALEVRHVTLAFEDKPVLADVSFQVARGETLVLLGVAASGKSVLLKLLLGLLKPDSGQVLVEGQDIVPLSERQLDTVRRRMGIVFQEGALFDSLSVFENVAYRLREDGESDEEVLEQRVREVLGFVEMEQAIEKMPAELSGGMRRRVAIARAIVNNPSIMLYDSPTAGLDPVTSHTINILLAKLRDIGHVSAVMVTHRLQDAFVMSNFVYSQQEQSLVPVRSNGGAHLSAPTRFLILREGGVYFLGDAGELTATRDPYLRRFLA